MIWKPNQAALVIAHQNGVLVWCTEGQLLVFGADEELFGSMRPVHLFSEAPSYSEVCAFPP